MSRIPYPSLDNLSQIKHDRIFDPSRKVVTNVSKMTLHVPDALWHPHMLLGRSLQTAILGKRLREMIIVRVGHLQDSEYELYHHRSLAANAGVSAEHLAALEGDDLSSLPEDERALMNFVTEVVRDVAPGDATLAAARAAFPDALLFEAIVIVGYYMMTARVIGVSGVELDPSPVTAW